MKLQEQILRGEAEALKSMLRRKDVTLEEIAAQRNHMNNMVKGLALDRNIIQHIKATSGAI